MVPASGEVRRAGTIPVRGAVSFFPYTANDINLPATLSGQYELRIICGDCYFSAVIELE